MTTTPSDFILVENDSYDNSQKTVQMEVELCTPDFHADSCECFAKQEQKIKELQKELDRQRLIQKERQEKIKQEKESTAKQTQNSLRTEQERIEKERLEKKKKEIEDLRVTINNVIVKINEQEIVKKLKYKEYVEEDDKYYALRNQYSQLKYKYDQLTNTNVNQLPFETLFNLILNPRLYNY